MKQSEISSLKIPFIIRELLRIWFSLRSFNLRRKEVNRLISLEEAQKTIVSELKKAINSQDEDKSSIYNLALFTLNVEYDISVLKMKTLMSLDSWDKKFMARQFSVLQYEIALDYQELLGKNFRKLIHRYDNDGKLISELNAISKQFSDFKNHHSDYLNNIRNFIGAHRDHNALEQSTIINNLDSNEILDIAAEFTKPVARLTPFLTDVMSAMINKTRGHSL